MDYKKLNAPNTTITRDLNVMSENVNNVYEMTMIIAKRANQIDAEIKDELDKNFKILQLFQTGLKKFSKIVNRLKFPVFTKECPKLR